MRVELALFGEKQNAHALISSSGDPELAKRITGRTDLPDQVPLGVVVEPCVCGFVESNVYVLSRIEPDHDAPRAGMVKTKALMMPLDEIIRASDLRPLITRLNGQFEPAGLEAFEWEPTSAAPFDKIETARVFDELLENRAPVIDLVSPDHMTALALAMWSRLFTSSAPPSRPEPELEGRLLNPDRLDKFLTKCAQESPGRSASLVMAVPGLSEARYIAWFTELLRKPHIVAGDADAIGRAVACRSWRGAAHVLLEAHRSRKDLKPALQACRDLYGLWDIWLSDISRPSESERSRLFFDVACDLFPKGPTQGHVWERAGGKPKDLDLRGTGADRWHFALGEAARGKLPKSALMREMRHDFPSNQQLAYLARFREFGGSDW